MCPLGSRRLLAAPETVCVGSPHLGLVYEAVAPLALALILQALSQLVDPISFSSVLFLFYASCFTPRFQSLSDFQFVSSFRDFSFAVFVFFSCRPSSNTFEAFHSLYIISPYAFSLASRALPFFAPSLPLPPTLSQCALKK